MLLALGLLNFEPSFSLCFWHPDSVFPENSRMNEGARHLGEKQQNFEPLLIKNVLWCKFYHNMTDSMTLSTDTDISAGFASCWEGDVLHSVWVCHEKP